MMPKLENSIFSEIIIHNTYVWNAIKNLFNCILDSQTRYVAVSAVTHTDTHAQNDNRNPRARAEG